MTNLVRCVMIVVVLAAAASAVTAQDAHKADLLKNFDVPVPTGGGFEVKQDVGFFHTWVQVWWIVLMVVGAGTSLYVGAWINHDCERVKVEALRWNAASLSILAAGAVAFVVLGPYITTPALLLASFLLMKQYVPVRNAQVMPTRRLFTPEHREVLRRAFLQKIGIKPKGMEEKLAEVALKQTPIGIYDQSGRVISPPEAMLDDADPMTLVKQFFAEAVHNHAREAYVVPGERRWESSFKVDGVVQAGASLDAMVGRAILKTTRDLVQLDSEDPHFAITLPTMTKRYEMRPRLLGEENGQWLCIRLRDENESRLKLTTVGLTQRQLQAVGAQLDSGFGMLVVTSPAEMGARSTVYAMLDSLDPFSRNIVTFEHRKLGTLQSIEQVDLSTAGESIEQMLETKLRQDYDLLMFDGLSSKAVAEAALTTVEREQMSLVRLDAPDELQALGTLVKLGVDVETVAKGLKCIVAQRVLRVLCDQCRVAVQPPAELLQKMGVDASKVQRLWEENPAGCEHCARTGFNGRLGIFSLWVVGEKGRDLVRRKDVQGLRDVMRAEGVIGLQRAGLMRVLEGRTSLKELARVLGG